MTKTTKGVIDPDVLAVAREIYGRRDDQKFGGNRRWRQLKEEFPELADAVRPSVPRRNFSSSVWDEYRDDEEQTHRHIERWAQSQTSARSKYPYRGGRKSVLKDAQSSTPAWIEPYGSWDHSDRGRWSKSTGSGPDQSTYADSHAGHRVRGSNLVNLDIETDGGWHLEDGDGSRENQLEVCRLCGRDLDLPRDDTGKVIRGQGEQREYCLKRRCRKDVKNARARAKTRAVSPRRREPRRLPDLSVIHVAGIGELATKPAEWNRLQPRRDPSKFLQVFDSVPHPRPWFRPPQATGRREEYALSAHRLVAAVRHRPRGSADKWSRVGLRSTALTADRIARRYETGGPSKSPELAPGWDRVETRWRFPAQRDCVSPTRLKQESGRVWCISH